MILCSFVSRVLVDEFQTFNSLEIVCNRPSTVHEEVSFRSLLYILRYLLFIQAPRYEEWKSLGLREKNPIPNLRILLGCLGHGDG
jgi:hypothetical protein